MVATNASLQRHSPQAAWKFCTERKDAKVTIVTTKQARFADAILVDMGGVKIPEEDLISTTVSGEPKQTCWFDWRRRL